LSDKSQNYSKQDENIVSKPTIVQFNGTAHRILRLECSDESTSVVTDTGKLFLWGRDILTGNKENYTIPTNVRS